jgi:hypothetical protein
MALAKLTGASARVLMGPEAEPDDETALTELLGYSRDRMLWGVLLGSALRGVEIGAGAYERLVQLARRAGADEQAAAAHLAWLRQQPGT